MKRVKQIVMMAFASLLAQCVWAAKQVGDTVTWSNTGTANEVASTADSPLTSCHFNIRIPATEELPEGSKVQITKVRFASVNETWQRWVRGKSDFSLIRIQNVESKGANGYTVSGNDSQQANFLTSGDDAKIDSNSSTSDNALNFEFDDGPVLVVGTTYTASTGNASTAGVALCYGNGSLMYGSGIGGECATVRYVTSNDANSIFYNSNSDNGNYPVYEVTAKIISIPVVEAAFTYEPTSASLSSPTGWLTSFSGETFTGKRLLQANGKLIPVVVDGSEHPWSGLAARTSSFTIALYADVEDVGNTKSLFELGDKNGMHGFVTDNTGKVTAFTSNGSGSFEVVDKPKGIHFYTLVYDKDAQTSTFYVDGVAKGSKTGVSLPNAGFQIGNVYANGSYGKADGLAVAGAYGYGVALTAAQVAKLAANYPVITRGTNTDGITYNTANGEVRLHDAEVKYIYGENNAVAFTQTGDVMVTKTCANLDGNERPYPVFLGFTGGTSTYNLKSGTLNTTDGGVRLSWNGTGKMYVGDGAGAAGTAVLKAKGVFANSQSAIFQVNSDGIAEIGTFGLKFNNNSSNRQIILNGGTVKATAAMTIQTQQSSVFKVESDSTIDANGFAVTETFGSAITGNGTLTLTDSSEAKSGSHTINSLSGLVGLTIGDAAATITSLGTFSGTMTIANADKVTVTNPGANAGTINLNGGTLTFAAGSEGTVNVGAGATLKLIASDAQIATGYTATNVTTVEGATISFVDADGNVLSSDGKTLSPSALTWTGAGSDNNFTTPENWTGNVAPTTTTVASITSEATVNMTGATYKSLVVDAAVTMTGTIDVSTMHDITMGETGVIAIDVAASGTSKVKGITGGKIVKTGAGYLYVSNGTDNGTALDGTTIQIDGGTLHLDGGYNGDVNMKNPIFVIGENGALTTYGWTGVTGTLTLESNSNKEVFLNNGGKGGKIKNGPAIVKNGTGVITLLAGSDANFGAITVNGGRLDFGSNAATTVGGVISGEGAIGVNGTGLVTLNGNSDGFSGGTIVTSGELKLGHKFAIGGQGKAITVEANGKFDANGQGDFGADLTLKGGTFKNSTALGDSSVQLKGLTLEADSTFDLAAKGGVLNNSWDATTVDFKGHTLTKTGNGNLTLAVVTIKNPGMIDMQAGSLNLVVFGGGTGGKLKFDLTDVVFGTAKKTLIQYPSGTEASIDNLELVNVGETGYTLAAENNLVVLKRPATAITMKEWGFSSFVLGDQTAELIDGDTILLSSELPDDQGRWDATNCSAANGHAVIVEQEMNWKADIGTMTINGVQVYTYRTQGAKIVSGANVSGTGTLKINDDYIDVEGLASITCKIDTNSSPFKLADGASLTVATALADDKVVSGVDTKVVAKKAGENNTIVYGLVAKPEDAPVVPEEGTTFPEGTVIEGATGTVSGSALPNETGTYTVKTYSNGFLVNEATYGVIDAKDAEAAEEGVTPAAVTTAVAVPFKGKTVATLLNTALLAEGDTLMAWINGGYEVWTLQENKTWKQQPITRAGGNDSEGIDPTTATLKCGQAVWVTTAGKIVTFGDTAAEGETVAVEKGHNLLGNPTMDKYTPEATVSGDQIVLMNDQRCTAIKEGETTTWITMQADKDDPTLVTPTPVKPEVGVGQGFWFIKK